MDLHPDERELFQGHPSWRSTLGFYLKGAVLTILASAVAAGITRLAGGEVDWFVVGAVAAVGAALVLLVGFVLRMTTVYTITSQRLHIRRGFITKRSQQTRLERVQNVNTGQSVFERVLGLGTVDFDTAGSDDYEFRFVGVADPDAVVAAVEQAQREERSRQV